MPNSHNHNHSHNNHIHNNHNKGSHAIRFSHVVPFEGDSTRLCKVRIIADNSVPPARECGAPADGRCESRAVAIRLP